MQTAKKVGNFSEILPIRRGERRPEMGDANEGCRVGSTFVKSILYDGAKECAASLTEKTGEEHGVECRGDTFAPTSAARIYVQYCRVVKGKGSK